MISRFHAAPNLIPPFITTSSRPSVATLAHPGENEKKKEICAQEFMSTEQNKHHQTQPRNISIKEHIQHSLAKKNEANSALQKIKFSREKIFTIIMQLASAATRSYPIADPQQFSADFIISHLHGFIFLHSLSYSARPRTLLRPLWWIPGAAACLVHMF